MVASSKQVRILSAQHYQLIHSFVFQIMFPLSLIIAFESFFLMTACACVPSLILRDFEVWCFVVHLLLLGTTLT